MPQSDQFVQNASFPDVRIDINDNLEALFSQSSGNSAPAVTIAFQPWIDTSSSPAVWKVRDSNNNGWITIGTLSETTFATGGLTQIANGGTGATTAAAALTALLPSQSGNSGKALVTNGTAASWGVVAAGASLQVFTSSGTYTPTAGKTTFLAYVTGGGGGGASGYTSFGGTVYGNSGGGGGTGLRLYTAAEMGSSATVTVGAGGAALNGIYTTGNSGGSSSIAPGGTGLTLTGAGGASPGAGGSTNSVINIPGLSGALGGYILGGGTFWTRGPGAGGQSGGANGSGATSGSNGIVLIFEW